MYICIAGNIGMIKLNLMVGPQIAIAEILADFNDGLVKDHHTHNNETVSTNYWWTLIWWLQR